MSYAPVSYTGNGTQTRFTFPFPYLLKEDVDVRVNGTLTSAWTFFTDDTVEFNTAPANGSQIQISRSTKNDELVAEIQPGSSIPVDSCNDNWNQVLYLVQEGLLAVAPQQIQVIDNLLSTSPTAALSANQGRILRDSGASARLLFQEVAEDGRINPYIPAGTIIWLQSPASVTNPPPGFRYASGVNLTRAGYPELFSAIGTTYGVGDGVNTFGTPLEANLINPFSDPSFKPYYKVGFTNVLIDSVILAIPNNSGPNLLTYNLSGLTATARTVPNFQPGWNTVDVGLALDGNTVVACGSGAGGQLYAARRVGNGWERMSFGSVPAEAFSKVAVNETGTLMVAVSNVANYVFVRTGDLTWGTATAYGGPAQTTAVRFSKTGQYLTATDPFAVVNIWKVVGSTVTFLSAIPAPAGTGASICGWTDGDTLLAVAGNPFGTNVPRVFGRSGDSFFELPALPRETPNNNAPTSPVWINQDRALICTHQGGPLPLWNRNDNGTFRITNSTGVTLGNGRYLEKIPGTTVETLIHPFDWKVLTANGTALTDSGNISGLPASIGFGQTLSISRTL